MKIIAFDIGSHLAVAGNFETPWTNRLLCEGDRRKRATTALVWFEGLIVAHKAYGGECVIYERPFARGQHATRALWGLAGILEAVAMKHGFTALDVLPSTIKKWACGKGTASKDDMMAAAKRMGYTGDNEHEADSFCLLKYAEANVIEGNE